MRLNPASKVKLRLTNITCNFTLDDETSVEVGVDDDWYPATWRSEPVQNLGATRWTRNAESDDWFAGPEVEDEDVVTLDAGDHKVEVRLTTGDQVVAFTTGTITVAE